VGKFTVYVIQNEKGEHYTGHTENLDVRLAQYNSGLSRWTRRGIHWILIYHEDYSTRREAILRERFLKSGQGRAWLKDQLPVYNRKLGS
jgi:putative endonuclease